MVEAVPDSSARAWEIRTRRRGRPGLGTGFAANIAAISPDVWRELVRRRLSVAALSAAEDGGLGGLVVLVRPAGIDVGLERQDLGPPELVLFNPWQV